MGCTSSIQRAASAEIFGAKPKACGEALFVGVRSEEDGLRISCTTLDGTQVIDKCLSGGSSIADLKGLIESELKWEEAACLDATGKLRLATPLKPFDCIVVNCARARGTALWM